MIRKIILALAFLCGAFSSFAQKEENILFVGNSLTYFNNMPQTLQKMLDEKKLNIHIDQVTHPGETLALHAKCTFDSDSSAYFRRTLPGDTPTTVKKILSRHWDMVILQEPAIPLLVDEMRINCTEPAIFYLDSIIKANHSKTVFYQAYTGAVHPIRYNETIDNFYLNRFLFNPKPDSIITKMRNALDTSLMRRHTYSSDSFATSSEEFEQINQFYKKTDKKINSGIAQVGYAFELCKKLYPEINVYYNSHNAHPSKEGSYLIACVFYKYITQDNVASIKYNADIDAGTANKIRGLVASMQ